MKRRIQSWKIARQRGVKRNRIPPFAPSKNEISFYKKYILKTVGKKNFPPRALILGATPELRDAAIKAGLESYAVDVSADMMNKFSALMRFQNHRLNKQIIKDWLKMKFPKNYFGIIIGDASLNNLATRDENIALIKLCAKIVANGGYLILRQIVYPSKLKSYKEIKRLITDFRNRKIKWEDFFTELRVIFYKNKVYNQRTFQYNVKKNFKLIDSLLKSNLLTLKEYNKINVFRNNVINTYYPKKFFIQEVENNNFKLISAFHDKSFKFFKYFYMFAFKKIKSS